MKCKCEFQKKCTGGKHSNYSINLYDGVGNVVKPIRFFLGSCRKADEICTILQVKFPAHTVMYDHC